MPQPTTPVAGLRVEESRDRELPLSMRADFEPASIDEKQRTVELVLSTGAPVERRSWLSGKSWIEELSLDPSHVRLARLNGGAPLLDSHSGWSVRDQLGVIVPGSARLVETNGKRELRATAKFSERADAEEVFRDVRAGIIRNVSIGYRIYRKVLVEAREGAPERYRCEDWEPYEGSMVTMGADPYAGVRSAVTPGGSPSPEPNDCVLVRTLPIMPPTETTNPSTADQTRAAELAAATEQARKNEAQRQNDVRALCSKHRMPAEFVERALSVDKPLSLEEVRTQILAELEKRDAATDTRGQHSGGVQVGASDTEKFERVMADALLSRNGRFAGAAEVPVEASRLREQTWLNQRAPLEGAREMSGMRLAQLAALCLRRAGVNTDSMSDSRIWDAVINQRSIAPAHGAADFAKITANVANKALRMGYVENPRTFLPLVRQVGVNDFKPRQVHALSTAPDLKKVSENGEVYYGTFGEAAQTYAIASYAVAFAITRKALLNDDTGAFERMPFMFGAAAGRLESDIVWALRTAQQVIDETGQGLYHASHNNTGSGAITVAGINTGYSTMAKQRGPTLPDGTAGGILNIMPRYLIVPTALWATAVQFTASLSPNAQASVNPFAAGGPSPLIPIAEPRLDAASATQWYLDAAPGAFDTQEIAYLAGNEGVYMEQRIGFERDGLELKARHDFGASWIDFRGTYRSTGV